MANSAWSPPTDPEGLDSSSLLRPPGDGGDEPKRPLPPGEGGGEGMKFYQLTHDYLVPSLRAWLTRKQQETRRGRAELRLAERAALWNVKPENRHLPSLFEWANIRLLTSRREWTDSQRKTMRRAGRYHLTRIGLLLVLLAALLGAGAVVRSRITSQQMAARADGLVRAILEAETGPGPEKLAELESYRPWVDPLLRDTLQQESPVSRRRLHAALALLPVDRGQKDYLRDQLLLAEPAEFPVLRDALAGQAHDLGDSLWAVLQDPRLDPAQRFRAACALAMYEPNDARWQGSADCIAQHLVSVNPIFLGQWMAALRPIRHQCLAALSSIYRDSEATPTQRSLATTVLGDFAADKVDVLVDLVADADAAQFAAILPKLQAHDTRALARIKTALEPAPVNWHDPPLDPAWETPSKELIARLEAAQGLVADRFAFCQIFAMNEFLKIAEALTKCGYRPVRFRPHARGTSVQVAAVWTRDGRGWQLAHGMTAQEVRDQNAKWKQQGYGPVDVTGYALTGKDGVREAYAGVWVKLDTGQKAVLYVGLTDEQEKAEIKRLRTAGFHVTTYSCFRSADGGLRNSSVWVYSEPAMPDDYNDIDVVCGREFPGNRSADYRPTDVQVLESADTGNEEHDTGAQRHAHYVVVWHKDSTKDAVELHNLDPAEHLARCRERLAEGYRPVAISVGEIQAGKPLAAASVWHCPSPGKEPAGRPANLAVAALRLGRPDWLWPLLKHSRDPSTRTYIIHRLSPLGADPKAVIQQLEQESDASIRQALILCLGEFGPDQLTSEMRPLLLPELLRLYRDHPDAGLHAAAEWLLRKWNEEKQLQSIDRTLATDKIDGNHQWYISRTGHTMVVVRGPVEFMMGSPDEESGRDSDERLHRVRIDRSFAIAAREVTVEQFMKFQKDFRYIETGRSPVGD